MYFLIRGPFRMIVEAQSEEEARQTAEADLDKYAKERGMEEVITSA